MRNAIIIHLFGDLPLQFHLSRIHAIFLRLPRTRPTVRHVCLRKAYGRPVSSDRRHAPSFPGPRHTLASSPSPNPIRIPVPKPGSSRARRTQAPQMAATSVGSKPPWAIPPLGGGASRTRRMEPWAAMNPALRTAPQSLHLRPCMDGRPRRQRSLPHASDVPLAEVHLVHGDGGPCPSPTGGHRGGSRRVGWPAGLSVVLQPRVEDFSWRA